VTTEQRAAWRWVWVELGEDEPMLLERVRRVCERAIETGDAIHRAWAKTVLEMVGT
jgi:hypothetical protein